MGNALKYIQAARDFLTSLAGDMGFPAGYRISLARIETQLPVD